MAKQRKPCDIDVDRFEKICSVAHTQAELAGFFGCSVPTLDKWCNATYNKSLGELMGTYPGAPSIVIDSEQFESLCGMMCTEADICGFFHCGVDKLRRWCNDIYGKNFDDVREEFQAVGRVSLRKAQFKMAQTIPSMNIWVAKQYLGQSDDPRKYEKDATTEDKLDRFIGVLTDVMGSGVDNDDNSD